MKFFSWRCAPSWIAVAHAESVAKARELLLGEVGGIDGSCVVRAKARKAISEDAPEIWTGPNAEFALTDSAELEEQDAEVTHLRAELAAAKEELSLVKCGEPNHPDRAYAMKNWLKTFGHKVYGNLKHGEVGFVLSLLQEGEISRGKAAEAIAELLVWNEPPLPQLNGNTFAEDEFPAETVTKLRAELAAAKRTIETMAGSTKALLKRAEDAEAKLAAERELRETAERQRDALAAALESVRMHVRDQYIHFPGHGTLTIGEYIDKQNTRAILAALKADQRRAGAAWVLTLENECWCDCCRKALLESIKSGEVEVPNE